MNRTELEAECYRAAVIYNGIRFWIPMLTGADLRPVLSHFMNVVDYCVLTSKQVCELCNEPDPVIALTCLLDMGHVAAVIVVSDRFVCSRTETSWHYEQIIRMSRNQFARILAIKLRAYGNVDLALQSTIQNMRVAKIGESRAVARRPATSVHYRLRLICFLRSALAAVVAAICTGRNWFPQ